MVVAIFLVMVVDMILLCAVCKLLATKARLWRCVLAVVVSACFAGLSMTEDFPFLGSFPWVLSSSLITGMIAFGISKEAIRHTILFALLRLSVGGIAGKDSTLSMLLGAAGIGFACLAVSRGRRFVPVELNYGGKTYCLTALCDTGHSLRDPVTGEGVLIVDAEVSHSLTGLEPPALRNAVGSILTVPGLRLIPYQSVGSNGFLLALHIPNAKIGNRQTGVLVALSPNILSHHYQALTGGYL